MANLKLYFSMISGDMYYIEEDEVKNLDKSQIPLVKKPSPSCKKCYGRFYTVYMPNKRYYVPCPRCLKSCADWNVIKGDEIVVETPETSNEVADHGFIVEANKAGI